MSDAIRTHAVSWDGVFRLSVGNAPCDCEVKRAPTTNAPAAVAAVIRTVRRLILELNTMDMSKAACETEALPKRHNHPCPREITTSCKNLLSCNTCLPTYFVGGRVHWGHLFFRAVVESFAYYVP